MRSIINPDQGGSPWMRWTRLLRTSICIAAITLAVIAGALIAPGPSAHAQTKGTTPVGTVTPPTGSTTGRSVSTNTPISPTQQPIYLSGRVVLEDGSALPGPVVIERVCGGGPRPRAHPRSKSPFSVLTRPIHNRIPAPLSAPPPSPPARPH